MGVKISNLPTATEAEAASGLIPVVTDPNGDGNLVTKHITASMIGGSGGASVNTSATPPGSPSNGDLWFDEENAELYIYNTSINGWIQTNGGGGGGSATLGDGWLDSAYWTRGVKSQGFSGDADGGYNWIHVNTSLQNSAKPLTDHDWYDNKGRLVSNFSVPSSYYLRFKAHSLIDMEGSSNLTVGTLIADGRQSLDSVVQSEDAWWSDNWWTVKNSYEKQTLAAELLDNDITNIYPGQTIQPGYPDRPMSCVISFSTNSLRGYGNGAGGNNEANKIYLIPA